TLGAPRATYARLAAPATRLPAAHATHHLGCPGPPHLQAGRDQQGGGPPHPRAREAARGGQGRPRSALPLPVGAGAPVGGAGLSARATGRGALSARPVRSAAVRLPGGWPGPGGRAVALVLRRAARRLPAGGGGRGSGSPPA